MEWQFKKIKEDVCRKVRGVQTEKDWEDLRIEYLGRKGLLVKMYEDLTEKPKEEKPGLGKKINELRKWITEELKKSKVRIEENIKGIKVLSQDVTLPGVFQTQGHRHLLTQTIEEICDIFTGMGFSVQEGPEIESEFYNFDALNIPRNHPSRDGFDTFYVDKEDAGDKTKKMLLRSQTSPMQVRIMEENKPPLAVLIPGRVYRPDAVDASHSFMFHQIEGLIVDKKLTFSDLKGILEHFLKRVFSEEIEMRFRPHFFPFTEPSAEVDILWEGGKKDWLEIMGCGMVHPNVFKSSGYEENEYTGLAFGLGVERIAMLKYGISDIRVFYENDFRFLRQF